MLVSIEREFTGVEPIEYTEEKAAGYKALCMAYVRHLGKDTLPDHYFREEEEPAPGSDARTRCRFWIKNCAVIVGMLAIRPELLDRARSIDDLKPLVTLLDRGGKKDD